MKGESLMEKEKDYSIKKENQERLKGISKALYIIAKICKVLAIVGLIGLGFAMIIIPMVTSNIKTDKIGEETVLKVFDNDIYYKRTEHSFELYEKNKTDDSLVVTEQKDVDAINKVFDYLEKNDLQKATLVTEIEFLLIAINLLIEILLLEKVYLFFKNIHDESSPFIQANVDLLRKISKLLIYSFVISIIVNMISSALLNGSFSIEVTNIVEILIVFFLSYLFEYGYKIQKDTNGKIYSDGK